MRAHNTLMRYRVPSQWVNNAGFARTGTITATQTIPTGREILMPYHAAYWRWCGLAAVACGADRGRGELTRMWRWMQVGYGRTLTLREHTARRHQIYHNNNTSTTTTSTSIACGGWGAGWE